jgi:hypothetical protein
MASVTYSCLSQASETPRGQSLRRDSKPVCQIPCRSACLQSHSSDADRCRLRNGHWAPVGTQPSGDEDGYSSHRAARARRIPAQNRTRMFLRRTRLRSRLRATIHPTKRHREHSSGCETTSPPACPPPTNGCPTLITSARCQLRPRVGLAGLAGRLN